MQMGITANRWRVGGCFLFAFGALSLGVLQAQDDGTIIATSEEPVVVIDSYEAALDGNGKSDLKIGEAVEPDFFNDIVDRIRGIFTNDDGSVEIGFLSGVFKSDTPALTIDAEGDAIFRGKLSAQEVELSKLSTPGQVLVQHDNTIGENANMDNAAILVQSADGSQELGIDSNEITQVGHNLYLTAQQGSIRLRTEGGDGDGAVKEVLRVAANGNVGIGTTDPSLDLDIRDNGNTGLRIYNTDSTTQKYAYLQFMTPNYLDTGGIGKEGLEIGLDDTSGKAYIRRNVNSGIGSEGIVLDKNGNVGIGTTDPGAKLEVNTDIDITANPDSKGIRLKESDGDWLLSLGVENVTNTGFAIRDVSQGTYPLVIRETTGNVGIGTTSPGAKLNIYGTDDDGWNSGIQLDREGGGQGRIVVDGDGMKLRTTKDGDGFYFRDNDNQTSLFIKDGGNVGIGTTSPGAKLEVNGELIQSKRSRKGYIYEQGNNSTKKYHYLGRIHSWCSAFRVSGHFEAHDANDRGTGIFDLSFAKRGAFKVNGFASGKFGDPVDIELYETTEGYNNGSYGPNLDVYLVTGLWALVNIDISETPGCGDKINTEEIVAQEKSATKHPSSSPYYKLSEDGVGFFADNSGNVGIGTTSPGAKLEVNGNVKIQTSGGTWITGKSGTQGLTGSGQTTSAYHPFLRQKTSSGHYVNLGGLGDDFGFFGYDKDRTANGYNYYFGMNLGNGRVGIGTRSPSTKLDVNGSITANSLYVRRDGSGTYPNLGEFEFVGTSGMPHFHVKNSVGRNIVQQFRGIDSSGTSQYFNLHLDAAGKTFSLGGPAANKVNISGSVTADYLNVDPQNTTIEGGEIKLRKSADTYSDIQIDNYAGNARIHTLADGKYFEVVGGAGIKAKSFVGDGSQLTGIEGKFVDGTSATNAVFTTGNVGIGTTRPGAKLEVDGGAIKVSPAYEETFMFGNTNETGTPSGDGFRFVFTDDVQQQDHDFVAFQKTDGHGANPDGGFVFQGQGNDGVIENIMTVDTQNNRVGIGTTYPDAKLEVNGDTLISNVLYAGYLNIGQRQNSKRPSIYLGNGRINFRAPEGERTDGGPVIYLGGKDYRTLHFGEGLTTNGGMIGVGVNSEYFRPLAPLHIRAGGLNQRYPVGGLYFDTSNSHQYGFLSSGITWGWSDSDNRPDVQAGIYVSGNQNGTQMRFNTHGIISEGDLTINEKGIVGIGGVSSVMQSSVIKLDVNGNALIHGSVTAMSFLDSSDQNKKKNIQTLNNPLETIQNLRGVSFRWKESNEKSIGFIAQEVEKVLPSLVSGEEGEKSVAYGNLTAVLVEAVKELSAQNKALQKKNQELDQRVSALESK